MVPTLETKISSPSAMIKIITNVQSLKKNDVSCIEHYSRELEKGGREYKESSSTQTSSSSSLLHKRKLNPYAINYGLQKSMNRQVMALLNRSRRNINPTSQRILSAKFLRIKQLQSELVEAQKRITDLQAENRTWRNMYKRQDSALRKYESQESHLPQLLKSHEEEIRVLTLKYKKLRSSYNDLETRYNKQFTELNAIKDRHKHLLQISQDKHLLQRERLTKQIEEMKTVVNELNDKIKLQTRRLDLEVKNYKHQLTTEFQKQKVLRENLKQSNEIIHKLQTTLEDKERMIANCKINHHVTMKTSLNQPNKICASSMKFKRNRSCLNRIQKEEELNNTTKIDIKETLKPYQIIEIKKDVSTEKMKSENNEEDIVSPKYTTTVEILPSINLSILTIKSEDEPISKSDSNNNNKSGRLISAENCENSTGTIKHSSILSENENLSTNTSGFFDKTDDVRDESCSERSEEFSPIEDIVSWLEVHEKINQDEGEDVNVNSPTSTPTTTSDHDNNSLHAPLNLEHDKKTVLLEVLKDIDSEKNVSKNLELSVHNQRNINIKLKSSKNSK